MRTLIPACPALRYPSCPAAMRSLSEMVKKPEVSAEGRISPEAPEGSNPSYAPPG